MGMFRGFTFVIRNLLYWGHGIGKLTISLIISDSTISFTNIDLLNFYFEFTESNLQFFGCTIDEYEDFYANRLNGGTLRIDNCLLQKSSSAVFSAEDVVIVNSVFDAGFEVLKNNNFY